MLLRVRWREIASQLETQLISATSMRVWVGWISKPVGKPFQAGQFLPIVDVQRPYISQPNFVALDRFGGDLEPNHRASDGDREREKRQRQRPGVYRSLCLSLPPISAVLLVTVWFRSTYGVASQHVVSSLCVTLIDGVLLFRIFLFRLSRAWPLVVSIP